MQNGQPHNLIPFVANNNVILSHLAVSGYAGLPILDVKYIRLLIVYGFLNTPASRTGTKEAVVAVTEIQNYLKLLPKVMRAFDVSGFCKQSRASSAEDHDNRFGR